MFQDVHKRNRVRSLQRSGARLHTMRTLGLGCHQLAELLASLLGDLVDVLGWLHREGDVGATPPLLHGHHAVTPTCLHGDPALEFVLDLLADLAFDRQQDRGHCEIVLRLSHVKPLEIRPSKLQ